MTSIKPTFADAAFGSAASNTFLLLFWALFILDDDRRREQKRRNGRKHQAQPAPRPKPPTGPRPF